jgi:hypothetical protein
MAKQKPCPLGPKHKWQHVRNCIVKRAMYGPGGSTVKISWRGWYKCACGHTRLGAHRDESATEGATRTTGDENNG